MGFLQYDFILFQHLRKNAFFYLLLHNNYKWQEQFYAPYYIESRVILRSVEIFQNAFANNLFLDNQIATSKMFTIYLIIISLTSSNIISPRYDYPQQFSIGISRYTLKLLILVYKSLILKELGETGMFDGFFT